MRDKSHYVVFGARDCPNKDVIATTKEKHLPGTMAIIIAELRGTHERGSTDFPVEDIGAVYDMLYFYTKETLDEFIKALQRARDMWDGENVPDN